MRPSGKGSPSLHLMSKMKYQAEMHVVEQCMGYVKYACIFTFYEYGRIHNFHFYENLWTIAQET